MRYVLFILTNERVSMLRILGHSVVILRLVGVVVPLLFTVSAHAQTTWGTYLQPFAATSLWNSRPVAPVLGDFIIPADLYSPAVAEGAYSTGVFLSKADDKPMTITGLPGTPGLWDPDSETYHDVTIPRWPSDLVPASGSDGHADIVDPSRSTIHSFYKLSYQNGHWVAAMYAWMRIDSTGWGNPAHYFQGARATGVPPMAGLIRKHEVADGDVMYRHALAMSLSANGLSANPGYVFPATSADGALASNLGRISEGARMMLPANFDTQQITNLALRKVAETLKVYGAYVVDRNYGTPFAIYVEIGSGFDLHNGSSDTSVASELDVIRQSLRQIVSVGGWADGNGISFRPNLNFYLLSMRGATQLQLGSVPGVFDTWSQAVVFPTTVSQTTQVNYSSRGINTVTWGRLIAGAAYRLVAVAYGGAKLRLQIFNRVAKTIVFDSGELGNGEFSAFKWPVADSAIIMYTYSGVGQPSAVRGDLWRTD